MLVSGSKVAGNAFTVAEWNSERSCEGEALLAIGIGLDYGPAVIGEVGSEQGLSFTVTPSTPLIGCRR